MTAYSKVGGAGAAAARGVGGLLDAVDRRRVGVLDAVLSVERAQALDGSLQTMESGWTS